MTLDHRCPPRCPVCAFDALLDGHFADCQECEEDGLCVVASAMIDKQAEVFQSLFPDTDWEDDGA